MCEFLSFKYRTASLGQSAWQLIQRNRSEQENFLKVLCKKFPLFLNLLCNKSIELLQKKKDKHVLVFSIKRSYHESLNIKQMYDDIT